MNRREHDATVFADHVVVVGIADLLNHRLGKGELILAGALGNHHGPCCLVRIPYFRRRSGCRLESASRLDGGELAEGLALDLEGIWAV
jgi:hypothetical protein